MNLDYLIPAALDELHGSAFASWCNACIVHPQPLSPRVIMDPFIMLEFHFRTPLLAVVAQSKEN
jgi:hypothetical protein